ncbi:RdRP-domain-containing protein [Mycena kentingensis (nom. inval.)]|nr:RdRP-domain-containing protein [Mycena kentingensis (nom. inval.)]
MELFIRNVAFAASDDDVKEALAERLHRPPFDTSTKMNFRVDLFRKHGPRGKQGLVTLPTRDAGEIFLAFYGQSGVKIKSQFAFFSRNRQQENTARIEAVRAAEWQDPRRVREERDRVAEMSSAIELEKFSFGRICRDGVFSLEGATYRGTVACNVETRRLDILCKELSSQPEFDEEDDLWERLMIAMTAMTTETTVHFTAHHIVKFIVSGQRVFLQSDLPPSFERRVYNEEWGDKIKAARLPGFDDTDVSALTSQTLCLEFASHQQLETFLRRCMGIHLPKYVHRDVRVAHRRIYTMANKQRLQHLLASLDFRLAFEVDKAIWAGLLAPMEAVELEADLKLLERRTENNEAAVIFRYFVGLLGVPELGSTAAAATTTRRRKRRRRRNRGNQRQDDADEETPDVNIKELLAQAILDYVEEVVHNRYVPSPGIYQAYHLVLTPSTQVLDGPLPDQSNSVLRRFKNNDSFLRVSFRDENGSHPRQDQLLGVSIDDLLENRYKRALNRGIVVGGRQYQFLGYSMSGLKEYSFIFVSPFEHEGVFFDAHAIRLRLGDFSKILDQPAMLGARWSQAFSSSYPSITLEEDQIIYVDDKKSWNGSVFTDGCSSISRDLAHAVWKTQRRSLKIPFPPSGFQYRCAGAKGMLVVNPNLPPGTVHFRPSQRKFVADDVRTLDIATTSARPILTYLNRPLIAMLEHHGVPRESFVHLQQLARDEVHRMKRSFRQAAKVFAQHGLGASFRLPSLFNAMQSVLELEIGDWASRREEGVFAHQLIKTAIAFATMHVLREIKHRGHIIIPGSYTLIGVSDEWDCLEEGEIYATIVDERNGVNKTLSGRVLITRSPQIHPGDLQFVEAVRKPPLAHLTNVVVFSCRGERSLPSMLGGGDLDGDIYNLITDETLYPPKSYISDPGEYAAVPPKRTQAPCTVSDVVDFVIDYIKSDLLGIISILHLRIGDLNGYDSEDCLKLAEKASHAVDFQKRGVPVSFSDLPKAPNPLKPDYLSGEGVNPAESMSDRYYPSQKVLGELYRNVPLEDYRPATNELEMQRVDGDKVHVALRSISLRALGLPSASDTADDELIDEMWGNLEYYQSRLMEIARTHTISKRYNAHLSEAELVSGTIQERYSDHRKRREAVTVMNLQTAELAKELRYQFQSPDLRPPNEDEDEEDIDEDDEWEDPDEVAGDEERRADRFTRAWAAFLVSEEALAEDAAAFGASSFGLIALGTVLDVIREAKDAQ